MLIAGDESCWAQAKEQSIQTSIDVERGSKVLHRWPCLILSQVFAWYDSDLVASIETWSMLAGCGARLQVDGGTNAPSL